MKKIFATILVFALILSLTSCILDSVFRFKDENGKIYYADYSDGIISVTNYHPYKFWELPNYQELAQLGEGAGLENEGRVYFIYVVDTSIDPDSPKAYYTAEFDAETKELLTEEGEYFEDEETKNSVIKKLLKMVDEVYVP